MDGKRGWWYHWDEMEKREASALRRDMVLGRWNAGAVGVVVAELDLHGVCVSDKLLLRSLCSNSAGASAGSVFPFLPSFWVRQLLGIVGFGKTKS